MKLEEIQEKFKWLTTNSYFEWFVISIILISALMIGATTYEVSPATSIGLEYLNTFITLFFLVEILIRFVGTTKKSKFFNDPWNLFDTIIVSLSLVPLENSEVVIIGRLLRVFRVLRLVSFIPELRMLVSALFKSIKKMVFVVLLMFIIFYIYAAIGSIFFENINPALWGNISISLLTLFRISTFEDWTDIMYETMEVHPLSWIYYLTFIFLASFVFLNMMIGIVLDVLSKETEKFETSDTTQKINHTDKLVSELSIKINSLEKTNTELIQNQEKLLSYLESPPITRD
jgi:voltage-gated sodium channel